MRREEENLGSWLLSVRAKDGIARGGESGLGGSGVMGGVWLGVVLRLLRRLRFLDALIFCFVARVKVCSLILAETWQNCWKLMLTD